jgi:hypothetical protein
MYQMYVRFKWIEVFVHEGKKVLLYVVEKQKDKIELNMLLLNVKFSHGCCLKTTWSFPQLTVYKLKHGAEMCDIRKYEA